MRVLLIITAVLFGCGKDNDQGNAPPAAKQLKPAPPLSQIEPPEVGPNGLRIAYIRGEGLDTTQPVTVTFGGKPAVRAAIVSKTKIQVEIPPGDEGSDVDVRVQIAGYEPTTLTTKLRYRARSEPPTGPADVEVPTELQ